MALNEQTIPIEREPVEVTAGAVDSVNGKTGDVWLTAEDVEALPEDTFIPEKTSQLENDSNFATSDDVAQAVAGKQNALTEAQLDAVNSGIDSTKVAQIGTNTDNISAETTAREQADISLQGQIDAISASSDVTDIVGTYADLQAYDTSKLKDNDIVKVLQDEIQNDETTYYRWSTSTETFTLIGEEGPYYTKASADTKFQDKLTAGANISIDANNEISATDTTYSNFTGTDGVNAGTSGLVPAPAVSDAGKYLKADGTWDSVQAGPTVVQTTGTSTTSVMSQAAATHMIYPSGSETAHNHIAIGEGASSSNNYGKNVAIGYGATATGQAAIVISGRHSNIAYQPTASGAYSIAIGQDSITASGANAIAIGGGAKATHNYSIALGRGDDGNGSETSRASELSIGRGTAGASGEKTRYIAHVANPLLVTDAANKRYVDTQIAGTTETLTIATSDWTALSASGPYDYSATVTATTTISATSTVELINDQAVLFGTYGFAIGSISGQSITFYSIGQPSASVSLTIKVRS